MSDEVRAGQRFGTALRKYRSAAGLTQEELALRSGLSLRAISDMERGRTARPHLRSARLLADALQLADPARAELIGALAAEDLPGPDVPFQLPPSVSHFTGRTGELRELTALLERPGRRAAETVVISAIAGTAGLGKTALAVHWAHQVANRFPDGQLYVNLRGYDPDQPLASGDALAGFLRALGVAGPDIPADLAERAARYRSLLAGRRVLVLLDNAGDAEQVRPLLPGSPSCMAVVTSRDALAGLVARDGARRLDLGLLPAAEAAELLRELIGERARADPAATAALAAQCARLPLALRVAAELAAASPGLSLAGLTADLADQRQRLDRLDAAGDPRTAIRAVFSWSVRHLDDHNARTFRFAGLHPGADFDVSAAATLTGTSSADTARALARLARAGLVQPAGPGRYGLHDLLRAYAVAQSAEHDSEPERRAALTRLFDHYLAAAAAVADIMFPADPDRPDFPDLPRDAGSGTWIPQPADARAWLAAERANLVATAAYTASHGWPAHAIRLAATIFRYPVAGSCADAVTIHRHACRAAAQTGDRTAEASALIMLGAALAVQGDLPEAASQLRRALRLYRAAGDRIGEARTLVNLGSVGYCQGQYDQAARYDRQALALYRQAGNRAGQARAINQLGVVDLRQGRHRQAAGHLRESVELFRQAGLYSGEASALAGLGELELQQGRYGPAADHLRRSLTMCHQTGSQFGEARALARLGLVMLRQGRYKRAASHLRRALALDGEAGNHSGQAEALNGLGETLLAARQADRARAHHADALAQARQASDAYEQARAHRGLASAYQAAGDSELARRHLRQASL